MRRTHKPEVSGLIPFPATNKVNIYMKKYYGIELLRFLTSVSVLLYHYRLFFGPLNNLNSNNYSEILLDLPFYSFLGFFYTYGNYGFPVFFAISGFVFSFIYLSQTKETTAKEFFINRFARLYPLHFLH